MSQEVTPSAHDSSDVALEMLRGSQACRCLFGPSDRTLTHRMAQEEMLAQAADMKAKYNFDFLTETPVDGGKLSWQEVYVENVPAFYRPQVKTSSRKPLAPAQQQSSLVANVASQSSQRSNNNTRGNSDVMPQTTASSQNSSPSHCVQAKNPAVSGVANVTSSRGVCDDDELGREDVTSQQQSSGRSSVKRNSRITGEQ